MEEPSDPFFVRSEHLHALRQFVSAHKVLSPHLQGAASFRVVLDTNIVLADIRWLASKRRDESARTSLLETIDAGTLVPYVPTSLLAEMSQHLQRIAIEEQLDHQAMLSVWAQYKTKLNVLEPNEALVEALRDGVDPDDAPFVALAEMVQAAAIVSNDRHIEMMGGSQVSVQFVLSLRDYSRAAAVHLNIRVAGLSFAMFGAGAIGALLKGARALIAAIGRAPIWIKAGLVVTTIYCIFDARARGKIADVLGASADAFGAALPQVLAVLSQVATRAEVQGVLALEALAAAVAELEVAGERRDAARKLKARTHNQASVSGTSGVQKAIGHSCRETFE